ncbi:hypothetical protein GGR52DRAFT_566770 [Hypoxylon sp. FL1284]|nr:hypothetical protein GGR52DRAFT_566770 [Hypoxylon sp. FL1284]
MATQTFQSDPYSSSPSIVRSLTLRNVNINYRDSGGRFWSHRSPAELSGGIDITTGPCMNNFVNYVGHIVGSCSLLYPVTEYECASDLFSDLSGRIKASIDSGYLWFPLGLRLHQRSQGTSWKVAGRYVNDEASTLLCSIQGCNFTPFSLGTVHTAMESSDLGLEVEGSPLALFPRSAAPSTGVIGTFHNNQCIDMVPWEKDSEPDVQARQYDDVHVGFVCAGHTSHSLEAGRMRRVTSDVSVRIFCEATTLDLAALSRATRQKREKGEWFLFCLGLWCKVSRSAVEAVCRSHRLARANGSMSYSVYLNVVRRICMVSISSGVAMKVDSNGRYTDNMEAYRSDAVEASHKPDIQTHGEDAIRTCFSSFFSLVPYISSDRAPRPSISSAQLPQAVCQPFCPATAAVSPNYSFKPLVVTSALASIVNDVVDSDNVADVYPGENPCVLYHNDPLSYEDSLYVSARYVQNGGFSTTSICRYILPYGYPVPVPGQRMCRHLFPWWKTECEDICEHTEEWTSTNGNVHRIGRHATGVGISASPTTSNDMQVKVRSFQHLQTGDKLTTGHGQKGVATIVPYENMPEIVLDDGTVIVPDVVVAMSSIVCRQTNGQLYEGEMGLRAVMDAKIKTVANGEVLDSFTECEVRDSRTGLSFRSIMDDTSKPGPPSLCDSRASFGYVRMYNQTQMTRERHFTSSQRVTPASLRTPVRRTRGGGLSLGEMEIQAAVAVGMNYSVSELTKRGDVVDVRVCLDCRRLVLLCGCGTVTDAVAVCLPYDTVLTDCMASIVHGGSNVYDLLPYV